MSNYTPFIKKLNFSKSIINEEFNLISSSFENQPLFSLGYHYYLNQVREKMESDDLQKRNFYLVVNEFEGDIPDFKEDLNNLIPNLLNFDKDTYVLSRDFYKLWEMLIYFDILNNKNITSVSLSENGGRCGPWCRGGRSPRGPWQAAL